MSRHPHAHGLVDPSIQRSRAGLRAVSASLGVLGAAALIGLAITAVILRITWQAWRTIRGHES